MSWTIITGGQTGVDRGGQLGAIQCSLALGGWAPRGWRDERDTIPEELRGDMREAEDPSYPHRTRLNVGVADLLLCVVPNELRPTDSPGTTQTLELATSRRRYLPVLVTDGSSPEVVRTWLRSSAVLVQRVLPRDTLVTPWSGIRLMVAGPRASRWPGGQEVTTALLHSIFHRVDRTNSRQLELPL